MQTLSPGIVVADRYRLERKLGAGGMGSVWLASDMSLDSTCAIKLVDLDKVGNEEVRVRFQREARAAAQIRSANVVDVFDHGLWGDVPFIVMEHLEGEDLGARLDRKGRLDLRETYEIVAQVARALVRAHALGIVHRDLKPENIFLVPGDDHEVAKVLDFGIAKHDQYSLRDKTTKTGSFMGTPYYMSPEQARGKNIDWRSDLWALGVIVFQCLTGKPPFESEALGELMGMILYDPIPKLTERNPALPPELERFWERAINRDRELRFQSAKELANALAEAATLERLEVPTLPPRASIPALADGEHVHLPSIPPPAGRGSYDSILPTPELSDASEQDSETGAPVSRTRRSVLPALNELTPGQKRLAIASGIAAVALIALGVSLALSGGRALNAHAASDGAEAPVAEPAPPPTPVVAPRLAEAPPAPTPSVSATPATPERELDEEQKKKDKKKRTGPVAPAGPAASPDYGI